VFDAACRLLLAGRSAPTPFLFARAFLSIQADHRHGLGDRPHCLDTSSAILQGFWRSCLYVTREHRWAYAASVLHCLVL
jgi:hypothetical protein